MTQKAWALAKLIIILSLALVLMMGYFYILGGEE